MKKNADGSILVMKPHLPTHLRNANSDRTLITMFRNALTERAKNENNTLKRIYDSESER